MRSDAAGGLVAMFGVIAVRLALGDGYLAYLKPGMKVPLALTGVAMVVLGVATVIRSARSDDGHRIPAVAWLLALPLLALVLVSPEPLGAYAASRQEDRTPAARVTFPPVPVDADGVADLRVADFVQRAVWDPERTLAGAPVRLTGFAIPDGELGDGFRLARFQLSCCAADAVAVSVRVRGVEPAALPARDEWVTVVGTWVEPADDGYDLDAGVPEVEVEATTVEVTEEPANPYE